LFFRFLDKGFIFLTQEQKKRLEDYSIAVYSESISLETGNYFLVKKKIVMATLS
jgi:hypothetical protein